MFAAVLINIVVVALCVVIHYEFLYRLSTIIPKVSQSNIHARRYDPEKLFKISNDRIIGTAFGVGVLVLALGYPLTNLIHNEPEAYALMPYGSKRRDGNGVNTRDFTVKEALKTFALDKISK